MSTPAQSMKILMLLFGRTSEGTYHRAFPWAVDLVERGHAVTIMCLSPQRRFTPHISMQQGVRIIETPGVGDGRRLPRRLSGTSGWSLLDIHFRLREIRNGDYDVVHTFEHHPNVALPTLLTRHQLRYVHVADGCDHYGQGGLRDAQYSPYRLNPLYRIVGGPVRLAMDHMEVALRRQADAVTVISEYLKDRARAMGIPSASIHRITGSANVRTIRPQPITEARTATHLALPDPIVAFLGAGQFDMPLGLEAFRQIISVYPCAQLVLIGRHDSHVTEVIKRLKLRRNVIQTGWCSNREVGTYLGAANVCLLPMRRHPVNQARWPNKIGAYMAAGRPTICSAVGDVAQLVAQTRTGWVCPPRADAMTRALLTAIPDSTEADRMGRRARRVAETCFAPSVQGGQVEALYRRLIEDSHERQ